MQNPVNSKVFNFHLPLADEKKDQKVRETALTGAACAIILNFKGHKGADEKAYIPTTEFNNGVYIQDKNGDSKIDVEELSAYLNGLDVADGKDGKVNSGTVKNDYLDLFGFKSQSTAKLESLALQERTYQNMKKINKACSCPLFVAKKILNSWVFPEVKSTDIAYMLANEKTKKYVNEVMFKQNPEATIYILEKYGYSVKDINK